MSTNQVPDIGDMLKFWEMRKEILVALENNDSDGYWKGTKYTLLGELANKIESLGKKEGE